MYNWCWITSSALSIDNRRFVSLHLFQRYCLFNKDVSDSALFILNACTATAVVDFTDAVVLLIVCTDFVVSNNVLMLVWKCHLSYNLEHVKKEWTKKGLSQHLSCTSFILHAFISLDVVLLGN